MPYANLNPATAVQTGFFDDEDVTLTEVRFAVWDYAGKADPCVALRVTMGDGERSHESYYPAADLTKGQPAEEGKRIDTPNGFLGASKNAVAFLTSLVNAGFPADKLDPGDVSVIDGTVAHVNSVAQPKRAGLKDQRDRSYLLVTKIVRLPWDAAPAKPTPGAPKPAPPKGAPPAGAPVPAGAPAPKPVPVPQPTPPPVPTSGASGALADPAVLEEKARNAALAILTQLGGAVPKSKLPMEAFRVLAADPDRNAVVQRLHQDEFLHAAAAEGLFAYDGQTLALG